MFAAIITRLDVAFICSRFACFNINLNKKHYKAADRILKYFYKIKEYMLQYEKNIIKLVQVFIYASDALFTDNLLNKKSS